MFQLGRRNRLLLFNYYLPLHTMSCSVAHTKELPTHFICVKLGDTGIKSNYTHLKEEILAANTIAGLTAKVFIKPAKLHLTFDVMHLKDDGAIAEATQLLQDCRAKVIEPIKQQYDEIMAVVRGIAVMNNSPAKARILYGKVDSESLQAIADGIMKQFYESGLAKATRGKSSVKLHMTLLKMRNHKPRHIDARDLLVKYAGFEFGSQHIDEIHLAAIRSNNATPDGFYEIVSSIPV